MSSRIVDALVRRGLLTPARVEAALREEARTGLPFGQLVTERGWVEDGAYADLLAEVSGVERLRLELAIVDPAVGLRVEEDWVRSEGIIPLTQDPDGREVIAALVDPTNLRGLDHLRFRIGRRVRPKVASRGELERVIRHVFRGEALDRRQPVSGPAVPGDVDVSVILHGDDAVQDALRSGAAEEPSQDIDALMRTVQENKQAADAVRTLFELCVEKGVISYDEFARRLKAQR